MSDSDVVCCAWGGLNSRRFRLCQHWMDMHMVERRSPTWPPPIAGTLQPPHERERVHSIGVAPSNPVK